MSSSQYSWRKSDVETVKAEVRKEIEISVPEDSRNGRISYILKRISDLSNSSGREDLLRQLVFCVSALVHHARYGGLREGKIQKIQDLAFDILSVAGVKPVNSKLAYLYGELYLIVSQIDRQNGRHKKSAWQQRVAYYFSGQSEVGSDGFESLSVAIRMVRLGHLDKAILNYNNAFHSDEISPRRKIQAGLGLVRCYRLLQNMSNSEKVAKNLLKDYELDVDHRLELSWENSCRKAIAETTALPLTSLTGKSGSHYQSIYILESILWVFAMPEKRFMKKIPSLNYLYKKKGMPLKDHGVLFAACEALVNAYDYEISLQVRLRDLSSVMNINNMFVTIEQNLLFLLASSRFLIRSKLFDLAELCMTEYSRTIFQGERVVGDPIGLAGDLLKRFEL